GDDLCETLPRFEFVISARVLKTYGNHRWTQMNTDKRFPGKNWRSRSNEKLTPEKWRPEARTPLDFRPATFDFQLRSPHRSLSTNRESPFARRGGLWASDSRGAPPLCRSLNRTRSLTSRATANFSPRCRRGLPC